MTRAATLSSCAGRRDLGAYGLRLHGLDDAARWMLPQPPDAPELRIEAMLAEPDDSPSRLDSEVADLALAGGGRLRARKGERLVRFALPELPSDPDLLHPYLAPAAALIWQWAGREALHGGAVETKSGAVLLFGEKEAGKSTLLAWLAREMQLPVVADDLAVIDDGRVLAGPRSLDLREPVAGPAAATAVRAGTRKRVDLPPVSPSVPVVGSVLLGWGSRIELDAVAPAERLAIVGSQRTYPPLRGDPTALLELASKPMFTLARPRELEGLVASGRLLMEPFAQ
jgi:hypothetical protein